MCVGGSPWYPGHSPPRGVERSRAVTPPALCLFTYASSFQTLGKVGTVTETDEDGDVTVKFGQSSFRYSPACCVPAPGATPDTVTVASVGEGQVVNADSTGSPDGASSGKSLCPANCPLNFLDSLPLSIPLSLDKGFSPPSASFLHLSGSDVQSFLVAFPVFIFRFSAKLAFGCYFAARSVLSQCSGLF